MFLFLTALDDFFVVAVLRWTGQSFIYLVQLMNYALLLLNYL